MKSLILRLKDWAKALKKNTYALYLASKNPNVPLLAKVLIGIVVAYALSPIDLIPDFIPLIGYLDDMLLLPIGIWLVIKLIPDDVWAECRHGAEQRTMRLPKNSRAALVIVIIWLAAIVVFGLWFHSRMNTIAS